MSEEEQKLYEFCNNIRRWILIMSMRSAPESCPERQEQFGTCHRCGYMEMRKPSGRFKTFLRVMKEMAEGERRKA